MARIWFCVFLSWFKRCHKSEMIWVDSGTRSRTRTTPPVVVAQLHSVGLPELLLVVACLGCCCWLPLGAGHIRLSARNLDYFRLATVWWRQVHRRATVEAGASLSTPWFRQVSGSPLLESKWIECKAAGYSRCK
jgi:hypothetical protein